MQTTPKDVRSKGGYVMEPEKPVLSLLSKETVDRIIDEAVEMLQTTGVVVEHAETLGLLGEMGAEVDPRTNRVKLGRKTVESAVASAPRNLTLFGADGGERFSLGDGQIHFNPGSAALFVYDAAKSVMRKPLLADVARFARLADTLEHIEAVSTGVVPSDVPEKVSDSIRLYISLIASAKPVVTGTFSEDGFRVMRDLLLARMGTDSLRDTPCAVFDVCPSSPLRWSELGCHDLKHCAQNAIPVQFISMPLAGALAPMSLLASVVQHTAETLSGVVIHQAWTPGSPLVYGGSPALFDMRHSTSPMGAIETLLIDLAYAEVGKSMGFPVQAYLGLSDAKTLDAQAGMEAAMTMIVAASGRIDFVSGPGMLNFENCQCLEKLVVDNTICGMARRFKRGLEPRGRNLGIDAILEGLAEGYYLTAPQTLALYRDEAFYPSSVIDRKALKEEGPVEAGRLVGAAAREVEERLGGYRRPSIAEANLKDMASVMKRALAPYGLEALADRCLAL